MKQPLCTHCIHFYIDFVDFEGREYFDFCEMNWEEMDEEDFKFKCKDFEKKYRKKNT